jgi:hypothetical protein
VWPLIFAIPLLIWTQLALIESLLHLPVLAFGQQLCFPGSPQATWLTRAAGARVCRLVGRWPYTALGGLCGKWALQGQLPLETSLWP